MQFRTVPKSREQEIDDQVACFTDKILSARNKGQARMISTEVVELQETILRIQAAVKPESSDSVAVERVKARLMSEWEHVHQRRRMTSKHLPLAVSGALIILALTTLLTLWGNPVTQGLPGAGTDGLRWTPILGALAALLVVILIWIDHRH